MLSDKEREAIEQLRSWREYIIKHKEDVNKANDIEFYLRTAINLIEKQSKEIEELKEKNKQVKFLYDDACKCLLNTVDKDKIKAKIEELADLNSPFAQRVIKGKEVYLTEMVQNILLSLLEKE